MAPLFVGKNLIFLPETNSTNSYAIQLLKNVNPPEGTVVYTDFQSSGRGQRGSGWTSERAGNLTFSVILKPTFLPLRKQFFLYIISALALYDTTAEIEGAGQFDIKIKWPNDILVNRNKLAGILIENALTGERFASSVIGIGYNVNQLNFPGLRATSLRSELQREFAIPKLMERVFNHLEKYYSELKKGRYDALKELYLQRLYGLHETLPFETSEGISRFQVCGIGENGLLLLEDEEARQRLVDVKEVKWMF